MAKIDPPRELREFARPLADVGKACYLVGGAVRDYLLGRPVSDFDVATDARPDEVMRLYRRVIPTGFKHGTVTVLYKSIKVEVTTFRTEADYGDARRPDRIEYAATIEEDLARRDFTMNAIAFDMLGGGLVDPQGGREDLRARSIRAVGDPLERFREDGLRPLRAIRFAAQLDFDIEAATKAAIPLALDRFEKVSAERVRDEFMKILLSARPSLGLRLMEESGMLDMVLPELAACRAVTQRGMHRFDVLDHLYASADAALPEQQLRLAALFHDIGKPKAKQERPGMEPSFHRHEEYSALDAARIMTRLRFPNAIRDRVRHLISQHMFSYDESWTDAAVRRFVARVGRENLEALFALRLADGSGITGRPADPRSLEPLRRRIQLMLAQETALSLKDLAIDGADLASLGIAPSPAMGRILGELLETVLDDPGLNERERLLGIAEKLKGKYGIE